jgi:hypothetical protein
MMAWSRRRREKEEEKRVLCGEMVPHSQSPIHMDFKRRGMDIHYPCDCRR